MENLTMLTQNILQIMIFRIIDNLNAKKEKRTLPFSNLAIYMPTLTE